MESIRPLFFSVAHMIFGRICVFVLLNCFVCVIYRAGGRNRFLMKLFWSWMIFFLARSKLYQVQHLPRIS